MLPDERKTETHESFGMLQFHRVTHGGDTILFGSSIPHQNTIRLSIHPGVLRRSLNHDWFYAESKAFIEVEMSQAQFAEAISSMNVGSGVPVTVRRLHGKGVAEPEFENKRMQFEQEFRKRMEQLEESLRHLTENTEDLLNNKKSINKGDRQTIIKELNALKMEIASNIPFMATSYNEQMDKTTQEAKAEVEAFTINKMNQLGFEKLNELKALSDGNKPSHTQIKESQQNIITEGND